MHAKHQNTARQTSEAIPLATMVGNMYKAQGLAGFYRGVETNIMRACVLNATKMGVYDMSKGVVVEQSKFMAGVVAEIFYGAWIYQHVV